jgi:hypothetical protein
MENLNNIIYTAVFFDTNEIVSKYPQVHPNLYSHHSTIQFKPTDISDLPIGEEVNIKVIGRLTNDKVDVLIVRNPLSKNKFPHITLSTAQGIKPFQSNVEIENNQDKIKPINGNLIGTVGYFDGRNEVTEKQTQFEGMEISKRDLENQKVVKEDGFMFEHRTEQFKVTKKLKQDFNNVETAIKYANRFAPIFSNSLNSVVNNSNALSKVVDIKKEPSLREKSKRKPINEINDVLRASLYFSNQKEIVKFCNKLLDGYINIPDSELIEYDGRRLFNAVGDNPYRGAVHLLLLLKAFNTYMVVELQLMLDKQEEKGKIHSLYKIQNPPVNNPNYVRDRMDKGFERMLGERKPKYYTNKDYANRNKYYGEIDENFNEVTKSELENKKLINQAHKDITRTKGKDYAPDVHDIQNWINNPKKLREDAEDATFIGEITKSELEEAKKKKADRCLRIARSKMPQTSAYRSGNIVRCRQGKIWKGLKEEEENNIDKRKIYVLVGPPSVGKSTWIKSTFADIQPYVISRDNIVEQVADNLGWTYDDLFVAPPQGSQLGDYDEKYGEVIKSPSYMSWQPLSFSKVLEANNQVHLSFTKLVSNAVNSEKDIVVDMTNMTAGARKNALKAIEGNESFFEKIAVVFPFEGAEDIIIDVARKRAEAAKRMGKSKTLPDSVMRKMFASFQNVSPEEGFDKVVQQDNRELLSTLNEKWSKKYKKSIDCNNPKGFSQKAHCKGRLKEEDDSLDEKTDFSKEKKQGLHGWFARQGGKGKSKGWVDCNTCRDGKCKSCGRKEGESRSKYPACRPTPSACKTRGKGKSWGKKSTNEDVLNEQSKQDIEKELKLNEIKNTFKRLLK